MIKYKEKNLSELIKLAQNNDENALAEIISRHEKIIYNSFKKLNFKDDINDLTQETLLKISKSIKTLKNPEKFNKWLQTIIHNIFIDRLRRKQKKNLYITNPIIENNNSNFGECIIDTTKTPDENTLACELKNKINDAVESLPALLKTMILLREIDGLSYEEISELTNLKINTVKSRISRARIKLKKELEEYLKI